MREEDLAVLADFDRVWQRVQQEKGQTEEKPSVCWQELLQGMYDQWKWLGDMTKCSHGEVRDVLNTLCKQARRCFCELQTACFLDTGEVCVTAQTCNFASCTPYNLRKLYQNAEKLAGLLQNASMQQDCAFVLATSVIERQRVCLRRLICRALQ